MALKLTMTCGPYDRAQALINGSVKPDGIDLTVHVNSNDQSRQAQSAQGKFDIVEFYTGRYIVDLPYHSLGFTAIPIFVKRMFRHSYIYVNKRSGIKLPTDLNGRRVGIQNWFTTTPLWVRGILEDEYGVDLKSITWIASTAPEQIGEWKQPPWLKLEITGREVRHLELISSGATDAGITTEIWAPDVHPDVDFLFPNYAELEREYFRRTGFFPIHHTLLIKTQILEENPWVAMSMFNAWEESKQRCYKWLEWQRIHQTSMWYRALWEEERAAAGSDFYQWGFQKTRTEVDQMLDYAHRQGFTSKKFSPEDMFHPSTLGT